MVPLATVSDPSLVVPNIAQALSLQEVPGRPLVEVLKAFLAARQALLVLDNFEQLLDAGPVVTELLAACPSLTVLVTSRVLLRVYGEHNFPVPPLPFPIGSEQVDPDALLQFDALRLYVERARALDPDLELTEGEVVAVGEICARLDGLPLAIELAAARSNVLSPQDLLSRLGSRLELLTGGARDLHHRQQTLRATLEWSHNLLDERRQRLLARLGVFAGGCTLETTEAVCDPARDLDVLGGVSTLIDSSLLLRADGRGSGEGKRRFWMLETVREYAQEKLEESGEAGELRRRDAQFYLTLAEETEPQLRGPRQLEWLERLRAEDDNLRTALSWGLEEELGLAVRLVAALWRAWFLRGQFGEAERWLSEALSIRGVASPAVEAKALLGWAHIADYTTNSARVGQLAEESLELYRRAGDRCGMAAALAIPNIRVERWLEWREEAVQLAREVGDPWLLGCVLCRLGDELPDIGELERAVVVLEESLTLARRTGDRWLTGSVLFILGKVVGYQADWARSLELLGESLQLHEELGDRLGIAYALFAMARAAFWQGKYAEARELTQRRLSIAEELDDQRGIASCMWWLSLVACEEGDHERAGSLAERSLKVVDERAEAGMSAGAAEVCAWAALQRCEYAEAADTYRRALRLFLRWAEESTEGSQSGVVLCLLGLAAVAQARSETTRAARLLGTLEALEDGPYHPSRCSLYESCLASVQTALGEEAFEAARAEGRAMTAEQAVEYAGKGIEGD